MIKHYFNPPNWPIDCWRVAASPRQIFDPCYFWPGAVYAGDGMCFLLVETTETFNDSMVGGTTNTLMLALMGT